MIEQITLYFKQGTSDKVYKASLEEKNNLFIVNFAYGRRGSTLKTGTKTQEPVEFEKAKKIYDKLVNDKASKGYIPSEDSSTYTYDSDKVQTGIHCQLLNPIENEELLEKIEDNQWVLQEKMDGKRMLIQKKDNTVTFINRKGFSVGAPDSMVNWAKEIPVDFLVDGEAVGDKLHLFDSWNYDQIDLREKTYKERLEVLSNIPLSKDISIVRTAISTNEKQKLLATLKTENAEGVVLKNIVSTITPGRPNKGGNQLKFKFYKTASVLVHQINDKRSVAMAVFESGELVKVGNVTIPPNKALPELNSVIEVRYLYAYRGGSIYQPTYIAPREDIDPDECILNQLKFKKE